MEMSLKMPRQRTNKYLARFPVETSGVSTLLLGKSYVQKCLVGCLIPDNLSSNFLRSIMLSERKRSVAIFFLYFSSLCNNCTGFKKIRFRVQFTVTNTMAFLCSNCNYVHYYHRNGDGDGWIPKSVRFGVKRMTQTLNGKEQYLHWHRTDEST